MSTSCDTFAQLGLTYTAPALDNHIISKGFVCSNITNTTCHFSGGGYVTESPRLNITISDKTLATIESVTKQDFHSSKVGYTGSSNSFNVNPGDSGYVGFTATLKCYDGVLEGCGTSSNITNGTDIQACYPLMVDGHVFNGITSMAGTISLVSTDAQTAANITENPSENIPPVPKSAASGVVRRSAWLTVVVVGAVGAWLMA